MSESSNGQGHETFNLGNAGSIPVSDTWATFHPCQRVAPCGLGAKGVVAEKRQFLSPQDGGSGVERTSGESVGQPTQVAVVVKELKANGKS